MLRRAARREKYDAEDSGNVDSYSPISSLHLWSNGNGTCTCFCKHGLYLGRYQQLQSAKSKRGLQGKLRFKRRTSLTSSESGVTLIYFKFFMSEISILINLIATLKSASFALSGYLGSVNEVSPGF